MTWLRKSIANRPMRQAWALLIMGGMLVSGGCRSTPPFGDVDVAKGKEIAKLRPGLVISMSVLVAGKKELDEPAKRISDDGTIVLPLLGEMSVVDMTLAEFQNQVAEKYEKYFIKPQVILEFARDVAGEGLSPWGFVTVLGRVKNPGRIAIPATRDMTVSGAIQKTGGFAPSAKEGAILVTRMLPDGRTETRTINLKAVGSAGRLEEDIVLEANDVVFVPEAMF